LVIHSISVGAVFHLTRSDSVCRSGISARTQSHAQRVVAAWGVSATRDRKRRGHIGIGCGRVIVIAKI